MEARLQVVVHDFFEVEIGAYGFEETQRQIQNVRIEI